MAEVKTASLENLIGLHILTGCDTYVEVVENYGSFEDANLIRFVLDGLTYTAIENPSDGYRSCMDTIFVDDTPVKNTFAPVQVLGRKREDDEWGDKNDVLDLVDAVTGKVVLAVGTKNSDDYYPSFVGEFCPENMTINAI